MWLIPILLLGAVMYAAGSARASASSPRLLPPPVPPGPIAVLGELVRMGRTPPPQLIMFAIAEAEALGRADLASDIVRVFIAPVVYQYEAAHARNANPRNSVAASPDKSASEGQPQLHAREATDDRLRAMLDADPEKFMEMARSPGGVIDVPVVEVAIEPRVTGRYVEIYEEPRVSSPIHGVAPEQWSQFCERLVREKPDYKSNRHVGQYRQNVTRLIELGVDPQQVLTSVPAQREALDLDLADAYRHAQEAGMVQEHMNRLIAVPGEEDGHAVTLSGMLGVIQCAGLDGAVGWLESPGDRKKFPYTTQVFKQTNGMF